MSPELRERIEKTLGAGRIVLFMKGSKNFPPCGFSGQVVSTLRRKSGECVGVNIRADPDLRQGLKEYSNWPTFPQRYVDGKLVGGCDIVTGLEETGELD